MLSFQLLRLLGRPLTVMSGSEIKALLGGWDASSPTLTKARWGPFARPSRLLAENHEGLVVFDHL